jgi:hypothetical protein
MQDLQQQSKNSSDDHDDEINLGDLIKRLARFVHQRYVTLRFVIFLLILGVVTIAIVQVILSPPRMSYTTVVTFTFPQSEQGQYPNNSPFNVADIINSNVLKKVWQNNDLEGLGVPFDTFANSVSISPYADNEKFIREKFEAMLGKRNLSQTETTTIERDFRAELQASLRKQAMLGLIVPFNSPLSGDLARKLMVDILSQWSNQAINQLGVLSIPVAEIDMINDGVLARSSPFQVIDYFYQSSNKLEQTAKRIAAFPGGDTLRDPDSGRGLEDLKKRLIDVTRYWISELDSYAQSNFNTKDIEIRSAQLRLIELEADRQTLFAEADIYRRSLVDYDVVRQNENGMGSTNGDARSQSNGLQLDGDAVQRLIDLGGRASDTEFRQTLTQQRVNAEKSANAMNEEIDRLKRRISAAQNNQSLQSVDTSESQEYILEIVEQLQSVAASLKRIQLVQVNKFVGDTGLLFNASTVIDRPASNLTRWVAVPAGLIIFLAAVLLFLRSLNRFGRKLEKI